MSPLIATLGTMSVYRGLTYVYARGQEVTSNKLPRWMIELADMRIGVIPLLVLLSAAVVCVLAAFLRFYPLGRRMYAVGSNPEASAFFGLRTQRIVLLAYVVGGVMCGLAGFLYAARVGNGDRDPRLGLGADLARRRGHRRGQRHRRFGKRHRRGARRGRSRHHRQRARPARRP